MCGIAGIFNLNSPEPVAEEDIRQMLGMIRHRGPDQFGIFLDGPLGLGSARLSIIDLSTGRQPMSNEDGTLWVVFNGEIFNYIELRAELEGHGHRFKTTSDTEVLLHAYERWGAKCLEAFNGQFAFAIWNTRERSLFLARDRLGVRPLYYSLKGDVLVFGSEIKAILAAGRVGGEIDPLGLEQVFHYWCPISPGTVFKNVVELSPGHYLEARNGGISIKKYWDLEFPAAKELSAEEGKSEEDYEEQLAALLIDAAKIRLRADVPVGAYLSGGLDSSIIASIIRNYTSNRLDTFSIAFDDERFDESGFQKEMARFLGTQHQVVRATHADIGRVFPDVIWHTEAPVMRTAPAPMFMLSKLVRDSGYKVVLTGEGADEFLGGYDIFKEAKVRRFWARQPQSAWRPLLLRRLYPDIRELSRTNPSFLAAFFGKGLTETESADYSHALRWRNGERNCIFLDDEFRSEKQRIADGKRATDGVVDDRFYEWEPLARAQFLEIKIFLSQYLLSSQGDRMTMAHSVEGRFPFLDCRVVEFCNRLPADLKIRGLREKYLLKRLGRKWLPEEIWRRTKRPYRAPIHKSFFNESIADWLLDLLSPSKIAQAGYFKAQAVGQLVEKVQRGLPLGETNEMALAGIVSTQLVHEMFVKGLRKPAPPTEDVAVIRFGAVAAGPETAITNRQ